MLRTSVAPLRGSRRNRRERANIYFQGPNPEGSQSTDGYYHPEDEVFLPWFMRLAPNDISEPTQSPSSNVGRYSLMGDLSPFAGFHQPATVCN